MIDSILEENSEPQEIGNSKNLDQNVMSSPEITDYSDGFNSKIKKSNFVNVTFIYYAYFCNNFINFQFKKGNNDWFDGQNKKPQTMIDYVLSDETLNTQLHEPLLKKLSYISETDEKCIQSPELSQRIVRRFGSKQNNSKKKNQIYDIDDILNESQNQNSDSKNSEEPVTNIENLPAQKLPKSILKKVHYDDVYEKHIEILDLANCPTKRSNSKSKNSNQKYNIDDLLNESQQDNQLDENENSMVQKAHNPCYMPKDLLNPKNTSYRNNYILNEIQEEENNEYLNKNSSNFNFNIFTKKF